MLPDRIKVTVDFKCFVHKPSKTSYRPTPFFKSKKKSSWWYVCCEFSGKYAYSKIKSNCGLHPFNTCNNNFINYAKYKSVTGFIFSHSHVRQQNSSFIILYRRIKTNEEGDINTSLSMNYLCGLHVHDNSDNTLLKSFAKLLLMTLTIDDGQKQKPILLI